MPPFRGRATQAMPSKPSRQDGAADAVPSAADRGRKGAEQGGIKAQRNVLLR
jgi:hypothetical protein